MKTNQARFIKFATKTIKHGLTCPGQNLKKKATVIIKNAALLTKNSVLSSLLYATVHPY